MDLRIKQRIVGILVLALFAVIILTVISGGSSSPEEDPALSAKSLPAQPEVLQLPVPQQQQQQQAAQAPQVSPQAAQPIQPQPQTQAQPVTMPQNINQVNDTQTNAVSVAPQVTNQQQPPAQQVPSITSTQSASNSTNTNTAVLSSEQEQAPVAAEAPKSRKAIVVPAKPQVIKGHANKEKKAPGSVSAAKNSNKTSSSAMAAGWMVQLGSFSNTKNAKALVKTLRAKGFSAHAVMAKNAQGKAIMRVFVGPEAVRAKALKVQKRLQNEQNIAGIVIKTDVR